ncbi:ABC transporter permease subunit [Salinibaculum rarum]|uniref:ABC transporter permease subunit n=1 Tax=Salinibaculum rarum TaxID=3058903 RepID=UPI00265E3702|nr:ABC transporter permease subunit [Salinibaculum sp. KK48]
MNRALTVAKYDFENSRRSYMLWGVVGVFLALILLLTVVPGLLDNNIPGEFVVTIITPVASIFVPLTAVIASYLAIAGERESGQMNILLSLPPSRRDVVLGKFLGRAAVVLGAVVVAFVVALIPSLLLYDGFPAGSFLLTMGLTGLLGLAFVGLAVGISSVSTTRTRAMAPTVGVVILFATGLWGGLMQAINFIADLGFDTTLDPEIIDLLRFISPSQAYSRLFNRLVRPRLAESAGGSSQVADISGQAFFVQDWFVFLLLAAWVVVPVAIGYLRFAGADLE